MKALERGAGPGPGRRLRRQCRRGAAELFFVLLVAGLVGAALVSWQGWRQSELLRARDHHAGRVFAQWFLAAHRAAQTGALAPGEVLTAGELRRRRPDVVPAGLPGQLHNGASMTFGAVEDGAGWPMAWAVADTSPAVLAPARSAMREGALAAGLAAVARAGIGSQWASRPAVEAALGRALGAGEIYVTADVGIAFEFDALHRRRQPGHPELTRMATRLEMGGHDIAGAGAYEGRALSLSAALRVGGPALAQGDGAVSCAAQGPAHRCGLVWAAAAALGGLEAGEMTLGGGLGVAEDAAVAGALEARALTAEAAVGGALPGLDAGALDTGTLDGPAGGAGARAPMSRLDTADLRGRGGADGRRLEAPLLRGPATVLELTVDGGGSGSGVVRTRRLSAGAGEDSLAVEGALRVEALREMDDAVSLVCLRGSAAACRAAR